jgi:sarcosine oxidase subunit gamma
MLKPLLDPCNILRVQTWDCGASAPPRVEQVIGTPWPRETGAVAKGRADILCTGPSDWWILLSDPDAAALLKQLEGAFEGSAFRATDLTRGLARFEIDDPEARILLANGCALDLDPSRFPPGRCARTRFAGTPVILRCTQLSSFELMLSSSYRDYLILSLTDATTEFSSKLA